MASEVCCSRLAVAYMIIGSFATVVNGRYNVYRTHEIEDNCDKRYVYTLGSTNMSSTLKLRSYKPNARDMNCHFYIHPPYGYEAAIHFEHFELGLKLSNRCSGSYLELYGGNSRTQKLCGSTPNGTSIYFKIDAHFYYYGTFLFRNKGFTLVATAYKKRCLPTPQLYQCANGNCIWIGLLKDGVNNCGDNSDEVKIVPIKPFVWNKSDYHGNSATKILPYIFFAVFVIIGVVIVFVIRKRFCDHRSQRSVDVSNAQSRSENRVRRPPQQSMNDAIYGSNSNSINDISQYTPPPSYTSAMKEEVKNLPIAPPPPPTYSSAISSNSNDIVPVRTSLSPIPETEATKPDVNLTSESRPVPSAPYGWI